MKYLSLVIILLYVSCGGGGGGGGTSLTGSSSSLNTTLTTSSFTIKHNLPLSDQLSISGDAITNFSVTTQGSKGTLTFTNASDGSFTYTPNAMESGSDSVTVKLTGDKGETNVSLNLSINEGYICKKPPCNKTQYAGGIFTTGFATQTPVDFNVPLTVAEDGVDFLGVGAGFGDFNGDTFKDAFIIRKGKAILYIPGTAGGNFDSDKNNWQTFFLYGTDGGDSSDIKIADVDNDGDLDAVFGLKTGLGAGAGQRSSVYLAINDGDANFTTRKAIDNFTIRLTQMQLADVNDDGVLDIIVGGGSYGANIYVNTILIGALTGSTLTYTRQDLPQASGGNLLTKAVAVGDINKDGFLDIVFGNQGGINYVYFNSDSNNDGKGDATFTNTMAITNTANATNAIALMDVNGDSYLDVVTFNYDEDYEVVLWNSTTNQFNLANTITNTNRRPGFAETADIDGDGNMDVIVGNTAGWNQSCAVMFGTGTSITSLPEPIGPEGSVTDRERSIGANCRLVDIDNDGDLDIMVTGENGGETNNTILRKYVNTN